MSRVLYLSYDGMTDPLGQSQVLPYLKGLRAKGHEIHILSFEKPERFAKYSREIGEKIRQYGIHWHPEFYHKKPPVLSTVYDLQRMKKKARELHAKRPFDFTHARSYIAALASQSLGPLPFLFDMRGFWADERVDGGLWNLHNPLYRLVYLYFKNREKALLKEAAEVVSLTEAGKEILKIWGTDTDKISVIPCCVDLERFRPLQKGAEAQKLAETLSLPPGSKNLIYSGSIGTWYLLDEMMDFYGRLSKLHPEFRFCFFTPEPEEMLRGKARALGIDPARIHVKMLKHEEMPIALSLGDIALSFIRPSFSKKSSSPTKLGEYLAAGLPVIANAGVGDTDLYFKSAPIGFMLPDTSAISLDAAVREVPRVLTLQKAPIRAAGERFFSLTDGVERYAELYSKIGKGKA